MDERPPLPARIRDRAGVDALLAAATNFEEKLPRDPLRQAIDLDRTRALLASVGHPQVGPRTVHVAGSKGKGTVARMVAAGLRCAGGGPVGLYTSPHLEDLRERIEVDGAPVADGPLARAADRVLPHVRAVHGRPEAPTFFEIFTAIAWLVFQEAGCRDVVLETGLGGRLDATNVCVPAVTVITMIELEHTRLLGDTVEAIAREKAGIVKPGVPVVAVGLAATAREVVRARAALLGAPFEDGAGLELPALSLPGPHHADNARAAWLALRLLDVPADAARAGIEGVRLPAILAELDQRPRLVVDGAHTPGSARGTRDALDVRWPGEPLVLLVAVLEEKDAAGIGRALARGAQHVVATRVPSPRCLPARELARVLEAALGREVEAEDDLSRALERARALAGPGGLVLCSGSVYLAGEVRRLMRRAPPRRGSPGS